MILGIDPGVRKLGYALIESSPDGIGAGLRIVDSGILLLEKKSPTRNDQFMRIKEIYEYFEKLFKKYTIDTISIEKLFFTKFNQNNAEFVYGIRGALILLALKIGVKIREFSPIELKKFVTGNGKAEKMLVQRCIMQIYHLKNLPEYNDAADALALAYIASRIKSPLKFDK